MIAKNPFFDSTTSFYYFALSFRELEELYKVVGYMKSSSLAIKDRIFHSKLHKNCFVGRDAVEILISAAPLYGFKADTKYTTLEETALRFRKNALWLGNRLIQNGFISHVTNKELLRDNDQLYIFNELDSVAELLDGSQSHLHRPLNCTCKYCKKIQFHIGKDKNLKFTRKTGKT